MIKNCTVCGKAFEAKSERAKYCSKVCANHSRYSVTKEEIAKEIQQRNEEIAHLYLTGLPYESISERFNLSVSTVCGIIYKETRTRNQRIKEKLNNEIRKYIESGHTRREAAEHFNKSMTVVQKAAKGIEPKKRNQYSNGYDIKIFTKYLPDGFEYVGNYTGSDGFADIKCLKCGETFRRSCISIRHKDNIQCPVCKEREAQINKARKEAEKEAERKRREYLSRVRKYEKEKDNLYQTSFAFCKECGGVFILTSRQKRLFCSDACLKRYHNRSDKRVRKIKTRKEAGITLKKIAKRDKNKCYLCGGLCDWGDIETREDGTMIAGNNYPSLDHIVPLAKGGAHTWDNIKLAHRKCNIKKRDNMPPIV